MSTLLHSWYVKGKGTYELRQYKNILMLTRITKCGAVYREYEQVIGA